MSNYAYLRVSTNTQNAENQKLGILEYCNKNQLTPVNIIKDNSSGQLSWRKRGIIKIIDQARPGDALVVAEVSRLSRQLCRSWKF